MKTIPFRLRVKALDCYIYGGYLFLIMQNGSILYGSFERIINRLVRKYDNPSDFLKIAFLRNEYYYGNQARAYMKIPAFKQALMGEWEKLCTQEFELTYEDIADLLELVCEWDSLPLDVRIYGMRMFVGCRKGLYEINLNPFNRKLHPKSLDRGFDGKVTHVNPKYNELVLSADSDGLFATSLDLEEEKATMLSEHNNISGRSIRTCWSDTDIYNYGSANTFSLYGNEYDKVKPQKNHYWEKTESKRITGFAARHTDMDSMMKCSKIKKEDIRYCFHGANNAFMQLKDGRFVRVAIKGEKVGEVAEMVFSDTIRKAMPYKDMEGKGRIISGATIPKGCVLEFYDKILLQKDNTVQIIDEGAAVKVRTFMSSTRYQDLLSVTMEDYVTIHAIDTLDLDRELIPQMRQNAKTIDFQEQLKSQNDVRFDVWEDDKELPF